MTAELYIGTQGWNYADWVGSFYPPGTRPADYLRIYSRVFRTVELDTTFYATPRMNVVARWAEITPDDFVFAAKVPRLITHDQRLVDCQAPLAEFVSTMRLLGPKLGPVLLQFPPDFSVAERRALETFLPRLPEGIHWAAEFRHRSWLGDETLELLEQHGVAWTMIDLHYMPRQSGVTAPFSYVRWLGDRSEIEKYDRVQIDRTARDDEWGTVLRALTARVERIYGYYNNHYSGHSPSSVREMHRRLGLVLKRPEEPPPAQPGLFD